MKKAKTMRTWALTALVVVAVLAGLACDAKTRNFPTQPEARNLDVPETTVVTADFTFQTEREAGGDETSLVVLFTDLSTGNVEKWVWDFGDGTKSSAQNPVHEYRRFDTYVVTLTVSNSISSDSVSQFVALEDPEEDEEEPPAEG